MVDSGAETLIKEEKCKKNEKSKKENLSWEEGLDLWGVT